MKITTLVRSLMLLSGFLWPLSNLLYAQPSLALSSATVAPGGSTALNLSFSSSPSSPLSAVQWTFNLPPTVVTSLTVAAGPALSWAGKSVSCTTGVNSYTCVAWGLNTTPISDGVVATLSITLSGGSALPVNITNTLGASTTGDAVTVTGTGGTVSVATMIPSISLMVCSPGTVAPGAFSTCTVILSGSGGGTIGLSSSSTNLTVPASLTIPAGSSSGTFLAIATAFTADQTATVTVTLNGSTASSTFSLLAPVTLSGLRCAAASLASNASTACTITLSKAAPPGGVPVSLSSSLPTLLTVPAIFTVPAGAPSAAFTASAATIATSLGAVITATLGAVNLTAAISLLPSPPDTQPFSLSCTPACLRPEPSVRSLSPLSAP